MSDRYDNVHGDEHCKCCCDDGVVPVGEDVYTKYNRTAEGKTQDSGEAFRQEVYGPCPACAIGLAIEFPQKGGWGPWGKNGFWQGRPWLEFGLKANNCRCHLPRASREEVAAGIASIRALMAASKSVDDLVQPRAALTTVVAGVDPPRTLDAPQPVPQIGTGEAMEFPPNVTNADGGDTVVPTDTEGQPPGKESHLCPHYKEPKDVPYSREDCAQCNPDQPDPQNDEIPF